MKRELAEEIGITLKESEEISFFYTIKVRNDFESENITSFRLTHSGPFVMQEEEVDEDEAGPPAGSGGGGGGGGREKRLAGS